MLILDLLRDVGLDGLFVGGGDLGEEVEGLFKVLDGLLGGFDVLGFEDGEELWQEFGGRVILVQV